MTLKVVISLFDYTWLITAPWDEAGYKCYIVDMQHPEGLHKDNRYKNTWKIGADIRFGFPAREFLESNEIPGIVFSFPPCTHTAVSGARFFLQKGPRALAESLDMFATAKELAEEYNCPYMIENPVSTFSTYCGKPSYTFHPYEYSGYLPEDDEHPLYPEYIAPRDRYPKKTCLWTGNGFVMPKRKIEIPESDLSRQHKKLGGKSLKTKNIRSATPRGFAKAVFLANRWNNVSN